MVNKPVLVLPLFPTFSADLLPQMFLTLPIAMLVNHLTWRTNCWWTMLSQLNIITNMFLMFHLTCPLQECTGWPFLLRALPFGFLVVTVNPGFVSCVQGLNPSGGKIFYPNPDWPCGPPSLLYNGYWVFPGQKQPGHRASHPNPFWCQGQRKGRAIRLLPLGP
jgi:hypothetical protein